MGCAWLGELECDEDHEYRLCNNEDSSNYNKPCCGRTCDNFQTIWDLADMNPNDFDDDYYDKLADD